MSLLLLSLASVAAQGIGPAPTTPPAPPPAAAEAVRFAVIGDNGTGDQPQFDIARQMLAFRHEFPYDFVVMVGDNIYTGGAAKDYAAAFERPYKPLIDAGIRFFAVLGNHDSPSSIGYAGFNMNGQRYYSYTRGPVRFFALDSNVLDATQLQWFEEALKASDEPWKIAVFHHPLYSNGTRHGSNVELRVRLEPLLVRYGVNVVFSGHDHNYERFRPQKGITYFVAGASGKLRKGLKPSDQTAIAFDQDQSFMLVEIADDAMSFRTITRTGRVVDSGVIVRRPTT
jgi:3',5'-cyclic AMP phosphodiesterase CpdA